jgi:flagellar biosynthesis protein FliQ
MPLYVKLAHQALATEFMAIAPIIAILLTVGIATAIFQAVFQIEDTFWIGHAALIIHQSWS